VARTSFDVYSYVSVLKVHFRTDPETMVPLLM